MAEGGFGGGGERFSEPSKNFLDSEQSGAIELSACPENRSPAPTGDRTQNSTTTPSSSSSESKSISTGSSSCHLNSHEVIEHVPNTVVEVPARAVDADQITPINAVQIRGGISYPALAFHLLVFLVLPSAYQNVVLKKFAAAS